MGNLPVNGAVCYLFRGGASTAVLVIMGGFGFHNVHFEITSMLE